MSLPSPPILNSVPKARPTTLQFWWDPPATGPVTEYRLQCIAAAIDVTVSSTTSTYQFTGLTDGTTYQFQIQARNNNGYSDPAYFIPAQPGIISGPPTNVTATALNNTNALVTWTQPTTPLDIQYGWVTGVPSDTQSSNDYVIQTILSTQSSINMPVNFNNRSYSFNVRSFTSPGWSAQGTASSIVSQNTLYGCYVTNVVGTPYPIIDSQGNQWAIVIAADNAASVKLYNRFGTLVQTVSGGANVGIIVYVSADGFSNLWMATITGIQASSYNDTTFVLNNSQKMTSLVDSEGNLIMTRGGYVSSSTSIIFRDKHNTIIRTIPYASSTTIYITVKISPTGIWSGNSSDPNTWISHIETGSPVMYVGCTGFSLDNNNNIIASLRCNNNSASLRTLTVYDKTGTQIGSITIPSFNITTMIVKYRSDGAATGTGGNSWRAYIEANNAVIPFSQAFKVNKYGQVIAAIAYRSSISVFGSDDIRIGEILPFSSTMGNASSFTESCLIRFCSSGQAATSWRAAQFSSTLGLSKLETPRSVHITSTDDIIYTVYSEGLSTNMQYFACGSTNSSFISTNVTYNNICMMKYTNSGSPIWLSLLQGSVSSPITTSPGTTFFNTAATFGGQATTSQLLFTTLDKQDNLVLYGVYRNAGFRFINANGQVIGQTGRPVASNGVNSFIAKLSTNTAVNGWVAQQRVNANIPLSLNTYSLTIDNSNHIIASGLNFSTITQYFVNNNMSTTAIVPQGMISTINTAGIGIMRYDPLLASVSVMTICTTSSPTTCITEYLDVDTDNNIVITGRYATTSGTLRQSRAIMYNWYTSTVQSSTIIKAISTVGTAMFLGKTTGNIPTSWVTQVGNNLGSEINTSHWPASGIPYGLYAGYFSINPSTNRIYTSAYASASVVYLYDRNDTPIIQLGNLTDTRGSNVMYFNGYQPNGNYY